MSPREIPKVITVNHQQRREIIVKMRRQLLSHIKTKCGTVQKGKNEFSLDDQQFLKLAETVSASCILEVSSSSGYLFRNVSRNIIFGNQYSNI